MSVASTHKSENLSLSSSSDVLPLSPGEKHREMVKKIYSGLPQVKEAFQPVGVKNLPDFDCKKAKEGVNKTFFEIVNLGSDGTPNRVEFMVSFGNATTPKNRYNNIFPYDFNSVETGGYFNASRIYLHGQHYIAAQGPKMECIKSFWQTVEEEKIPLIVNLTMATEVKGGQLREKCFNYWDQERLVLAKGLELKKESERLIYENEHEERLVERMFDINGHKVRQLHFENWPDQGKPDMDVFLKLMEEAGGDEQMLVHCSAGVGRTGTFITAHSNIYGKLEKGKEKVCLDRSLLKLRLQRMYMIQTDEQFKTVAKAIKAWSLKA